MAYEETLSLVIPLFLTHPSLERSVSFLLFEAANGTYSTWLNEGYPAPLPLMLCVPFNVLAIGLPFQDRRGWT